MRIAVFFGGKSNEREISVITGMLVTNLLRSSEHEIMPVYLSPAGGMYTSPKMKEVRDVEGKLSRVTFTEGGLLRGRKRFAIDCALNCCHGGPGEDGTLSALLTYYGIPSASPDMTVSSAFMNKEISKIVAMGLEIPTARAFSVHESRWKNARDEVLAEAEKFGYPVIVKPVRLGSSIGIGVAKNAAQFSAALALAFRLDDAALVEEYFTGKRDINVAAMRKDGQVTLSPLEEVFSDGELLSFSEKYEHAATRSKCPADLDERIAEGIRESIRRIADAFSLRGVVRADFLVVGDRYYFNELNTVPGSLAMYLFGKTLTENRDFLLSLIAEAMQKKAEKEVLSTGILTSPVFSAKGGKRR